MTNYIKKRKRQNGRQGPGFMSKKALDAFLKESYRATEHVKELLGEDYRPIDFKRVSE